MKRMIAMLLALVMAFTLCACGSKELTDAEKEAIYEEVAAKKAAAEKEAAGQSADTLESAAEDAMLAVEDFEITEIEKNGLFRFSVKIRNISESDLEEIVFYYQVLDANGDILSDQACSAKQVAAGQAIWAGPFKVKIEDSHIDEAAAMRFVTAVGFKTGAPLKEPVTFWLEDYM